jgi:hypothetical protein
MPGCAHCGGEVENRHRFCPWCAMPQRRKLVEFFRPHAQFEAEAGRALRVSRYLGVTDSERHVRFSVWDESGRAESALSLDETEAERLARFVLDTGKKPLPRPRALDTLRDVLRL